MSRLQKQGESRAEQLENRTARLATGVESVGSDSVALAVFSGLIAFGESSLNKIGIESLIRRQVDASSMHEIILQSYLFCGFPRMLDALFDFSELVESTSYASNPAVDCANLAYSASESKEYETRGRELIKRIYAGRYDKLEKAITEMSPEVFRLMIMEGYGKTLSRAGLDIETRELAVIAALTVDGRPRQLRAHLQGAKNVGVSAGLVSELFESLAIFAIDDRMSVAKTMFGEVYSN